MSHRDQRYKRRANARCCECSCVLSPWYFERDGQLFCKKDYWARFGEQCRGCSEMITTGVIMVAGEHKYHSECFICENCRMFIGDGDSYTLVEHSKLYCGHCYYQCASAQQSGTDSSRLPHTVALVSFPPSAESRRGLSLSVDQCSVNGNTPIITVSQLDSCSSPEIKGLIHVGDSVLEINGISAQNIPYNEIDMMIHDLERCLKLTVEHNPNGLHREDDPLEPLKEESDRTGKLDVLLPQSLSPRQRSRHIL